MSPSPTNFIELPPDFLDQVNELMNVPLDETLILAAAGGPGSRETAEGIDAPLVDTGSCPAPLPARPAWSDLDADESGHGVRIDPAVVLAYAARRAATPVRAQQKVLRSAVRIAAKHRRVQSSSPPAAAAGISALQLWLAVTPWSQSVWAFSLVIAMIGIIIRPRRAPAACRVAGH